MLQVHLDGRGASVRPAWGFCQMNICLRLQLAQLRDNGATVTCSYASFEVQMQMRAKVETNKFEERSRRGLFSVRETEALEGQKKRNSELNVNVVFSNCFADPRRT